MEAVLDSSFLISLSRAGLLDLIQKVPFDLILLDVVKTEAVASGIAAGHPDAAAIETATGALAVRATRPSAGRTVDTVVVEAAATVGLLVANDLALGRRARNLGAQWLRTADVIVLLTNLGRLEPPAARAAIVALRDATRITTEMADTYLGRLPGRAS